MRLVICGVSRGGLQLGGSRSQLHRAAAAARSSKVPNMSIRDRARIDGHGLCNFYCSTAGTVSTATLPTGRRKAGSTPKFAARGNATACGSPDPHRGRARSAPASGWGAGVACVLARGLTPPALTARKGNGERARRQRGHREVGTAAGMDGHRRLEALHPVSNCPRRNAARWSPNSRSRACRTSLSVRPLTLTKGRFGNDRKAIAASAASESSATVDPDRTVLGKDGKEYHKPQAAIQIICAARSSGRGDERPHAMKMLRALRFTLAAAVVLTVCVVAVPAGPITWCDPASPLFDPVICADRSPHGGYGCDPFGPVYNPDYCAAQSRSDS